MSLEKENSKRIAKNTLLLYIRMLFLMCISLYTSRIVLNILGVEDYGIYNVVGGVVTLFSIFTGSLSTATQRFFSIAIGKNNKDELNKVYSISITIFLIIALIIFIFSELLGLYIINYKLNIPYNRVYAANWVFQCSIISFVFSIISIPYNALIISQEKIQAFAYISVLEAVLKLFAVYLLNIINVDKLIIYSIIIMFIAVIIRSVYNFYCKRKFKECRYELVFDLNAYKQILSFSGWNIIGAMAIILKEQGINILLNIFCGVAINTARAVTNQINNAINSFILNFQTALNPQITKAYAAKNYTFLNKLINKGSKYSSLLFIILGLPLFLESNFVLELWLGKVPDYTVIFLRLIIIQTYIESFSNPLIVSLLATGKIRNYQIIVGGIIMLNLPLSYIFLKLGFEPYITIIIAAILSLIGLIARMIFLSHYIPFSIYKYIKEVILKSLLVLFTSIPFPIIVQHFIINKYFSFIITCLICFISTLIIIFYIGLDQEERVFVYNKLSKYNIR